MTARVQVLYLGGVGRSGSTLLDRLLDAVPGITSAGELVHLWQRGALADERCGCGETFSRCTFWSAVGRQAYDRQPWHDAGQLQRIESSLVKTRCLPLLANPGLLRGFDERLSPLRDRLARLYPAVAQAAGARVVVDSSKHASYAYLLRHVPGVDLRVVHVVRDPEGVAYSWTKQVHRPESTSAEQMPRYSPARVSLRWTAQNALFDALAQRGVPTVRVRYEDLVADPKSSLRRALAVCGLEPAEGDLAHVGDGVVELAPTHSVAGNPMRFRSGMLPLRVDDDWRAYFAKRHRRTVNLLTRPVRSRYTRPLTGTPLPTRSGA